MTELVDLEELGFDVTFQRHTNHEEHFTCTVRRWNETREKFMVKSFHWINDRGVKYIKTSDRLKRFFEQHYFDIERITGLKINWEKYDHEI